MIFSHLKYPPQSQQDESSHAKNQWQNRKDQLVQISKLNTRTFQKQVIHYTPHYLYTHPQGKIFHPTDWSIQNFQIGRSLGKGKYGHVYLARQRKTKTIVAIKVITKKQFVNGDIIFQIRRQIQIHSHLDHENILKMHGYFFDQKRIYIILDYAPYGQLYKILQDEGQFNQYRAARYIYQMIQALKHIHAHKIIHRDIKPQNILLSIDDQIKLTDFGWSIHVSDNKKRRRTYCGTPDYICPEIAFKKQYDYRLDLWCLGVLTYQFVAGYPPFSDNAGDNNQLIGRIRQVSYDFPSHFSKQIKSFISSFLKAKFTERMSLEEAEEHIWIKKYYLQVEKQKEKRQQAQNKGHQTYQRDLQI